MILGANLDRALRSVEAMPSKAGISAAALASPFVAARPLTSISAALKPSASKRSGARP
jgi:hypothetical protein